MLVPVRRVMQGGIDRYFQRVRYPGSARRASGAVSGHQAIVCQKRRYQKECEHS
jgi:hypothetical protein